MKIRAIITGATGMVGEGVLHECLNHAEVEEVLIINRRPSGFSHPKLREIVHADFQQIESLKDQLTHFNACFFCLGVSSVGLKEDEYTRLTYDLTLRFATLVSSLNPDMVFCYVSGSGTDSSEKGKSMWARVKGRTENDLLKLPFKGAYMFRPGYMHPTRGLKNTLKMVHAVSWLYPIARPLFPDFVCTLREVGLAMIQCVKAGYKKPHIEVADIVQLASDESN